MRIASEILRKLHWPPAHRITGRVVQEARNLLIFLELVGVAPEAEEVVTKLSSSFLQGGAYLVTSFLRLSRSNKFEALTSKGSTISIITGPRAM